MRLALGLVIAVLLGLASEAVAAMDCSPRDNTARILTRPSPNAIHPDWRGESYVGLSWSLKTSGHVIHGDPGYFLRGDLYSPRGGLVNRRIYVIAREWDCGAQ